jgi:protein-tyrosine phosphatase
MASRAQSLYLRATAGPSFVQARFGSARGLARLWLSRLRQRRLRRYREIDWRRVERLVFVCTGNICRSPYAEALARRAGFPTASVALRGGTGAPAYGAALAAARAAGVDLAAHRSTAISEAAIGPGDLLVAMEPWQADALAARQTGAQVTLLGLWTSPERPHLHDPHGLSDNYFRTCFRIIDTGVAAILQRTGR